MDESLKPSTVRSEGARRPSSGGNAQETVAHSSGSRGELEVRCPNCRASMDVAGDTQFTDLTCGSCGSHFSLIDQGQATRMAPPLSQMGRFELVERIGVGGFGSVWKARDKELDRTVAIKIPRQGGMNAEEQEKFFREARAAAQLRHPNIVSVHEVGRDGDSVYIVSDFVRGVTLGDWLTGQQLTGRESAELTAKIADALEHAHDQGVVHRDLKPANIMIDGDGEPHLMDFGLARRDVGEVTVTMDGQVLGTPAYMSPEQAEGKAHTADRRSDIYSLGVILFQLLTGELPFRGNARMLMHQVIHDEPPSPRKLNANVAKDLETITLKCLEKDQNRRYQKAVELNQELARHLAGEPILARPLGSFERGWRWVKRNPRVAVLTASVAILLVAIAALSTIGFAVAKRQQLAAQEAAEREAQLRKESQESAAREARLRGLAEQNLGIAQQAVDGYLTRVAEDERLKQNDFHKLRTELLETAVPFYEQFAKQKPGDVKSQANQAEAYARLASIHGDTGRPELSAKEYEQALAIQNDLAEKHPDQPEYKQELAEQHLQLGWNLHVVGGYDRAQPHYESALAILMPLIQAHPDKPEFKHLAARTHEKFGMLLRNTEADAAREHFQQAIKLEEDLLAVTPNVPEYESTLASSSFYLGFLLNRSDSKQARVPLSKAAEIQRKLAAANPKDPEYRAALAESVAYLGSVEQALGNNDAARRQFEEGVQIGEQVVHDFPSVVKYRVNLAGMLNTYGQMLRIGGDLPAALREQERYTEVREQLAADFPDVKENIRYAADGHRYCASLATMMGDFPTARKHHEHSAAIFDEIAAANPNDQNACEMAAEQHANFGAWLVEREDWSAAIKQHEAAIDLFSKFATTGADVNNLRNWTFWLHQRASEIATNANDWDAAKKHIDVLEKLAAASPENEDYQGSLVVSLNEMAWLLATSPAEDVRDGKRAVELATKACDISKYEIPEYLDTLAAAYAETGDFNTAVKWSTKAIELIDNKTNQNRKTTLGWIRSALAPDSEVGARRAAIERNLKSFQEKKPIREQPRIPTDQPSGDTQPSSESAPNLPEPPPNPADTSE